MAPLLEQLKNFIRHGKNGKQMTARDSGTSLETSHKSKSRGGSRNTSPSRTLYSASAPASSLASATFAAREASETPRQQDDGKNSSGNNAQVNSSKHHQQSQPQENTSSAAAAAAAAAPTTTTEAASRIVAEEKEQKSKMPVYPGLERYRLLEKMGDGAFSNVYKAHDTKMDRVVAVKVVRKFELNSHQRANILKEVQIMRQLKHPGVIELYDFFESAEHYFLILELAQGGELFHRIVKLTYFSEELTRHVIVQVAQAIRYLHEEKGVIHRDIKPENILFEPIPIIPSPPNARPDEEDKEDEGVFQPGIGGGGIGRVKLADFGLSKVVWNEQTMTPCGTVGYTAPEIVKDERYSKSVDMWALGCVLYTLLCGFPPFYDESIQALTEKVARGQYSFLSPWWDEISASVKDLITHLLCVNPAERYTIDQFLAHPWIKEGEKLTAAPAAAQMAAATADAQAPAATTAAVENKLLTNVQAMTPDVAVKSPYRRRAENPLSPGIGLKEVFDVSNAVHRMEEESMRRHAMNNNNLHPTDALNFGHRHGANAFLASLNEDEDEEEEEDSVGPEESYSEDSDVEAKKALRLQQQQQQQEYQRAQEQIAAHNLSKATIGGGVHSIPVVHNQPHHPPQPHHTGRAAVPGAAGPQATHGRQQNSMSTSASTSTMASTTSSTSSSQRRRRAGFELNINQATLLNRRKQHLNNDHSLEQQEQRMSQEQPALVV
ncbi:hypothetical protein BGW41_005359 [Actinomortierella wolfii]|nr:hypothetical protein BGW41_005359 [Actinomortierella wolfii]